MKDYTKIIYTNIMDYRVSDGDCKRLIYEAKIKGIPEIILSPASLCTAEEPLEVYPGRTELRSPIRQALAIRKIRYMR